MYVGRVIGTVWATQKTSTLTGLRMLLVRPLTARREGGADAVAESEQVLVAADPVGAGAGETVLVAVGRAARNVLGSQDLGWQVAVVGIVDAMSLGGGAPVALATDGRLVRYEAAPSGGDGTGRTP